MRAGFWPALPRSHVQWTLAQRCDLRRRALLRSPSHWSPGLASALPRCGSRRCFALEHVQIRQSGKPQRFPNKPHRSGAGDAARPLVDRFV